MNSMDKANFFARKNRQAIETYLRLFLDVFPALEDTHRAMFKLGGKNLFVLCLLVKNLSAVYSADRCDF